MLLIFESACTTADWQGENKGRHRLAVASELALSYVLYRLAGADQSVEQLDANA